MKRKRSRKLFNKSRGALLIEVLVAMTISAILLPALLIGLLASSQGKAQQNKRIAAIALMKEAEEVVRSVRESGWASIPAAGTYHPTTSSNSWSLASGSDTIYGYTRSVVVSDVYRDTNGVIVQNGGVIDKSTKKISISISWGFPYASTATSTMYLTRYLQNSASTQTSQADFTSGTTTNTAVTNSSGGEIVLAPNTKGKWCSPSFSSTTISLPDGPPVSISATASATLTNPNDIFVATSPTTSNSYKLAYINVPANIDPPVATLEGTFTMDSSKYSAPGLVPSGTGLDNSFITNQVKYYKSTGGNLYALLTTTKPDKEVIAIQVKNGSSYSYQDPTNHIFKYWTFFDTKMYGSTTGLNTGYLNPTANASDTGGDGNGYETNPTRAYSSNTSYATDNNSGSGTGTNCTGADKDKHRFYNYGFSIPTGATIDGIEVRLDGKADGTTGSPKFCAQLSWDGGTTWTTAKTTSNLTTSNATYVLGTASDTWGRTWADANFSDSNFRVRIIDVASDNSRDFSLDWVGVKVHYSGGTLTSSDQAPYGAGASSVAVIDNTGYVVSGGYLYSFDLSNIDSKTPSSGLDMIGCRIELDGYDCNASTSKVRKYTAGNTDTNWGSESAGQAACLDGGATQIFADNDIYPVKVGGNSYVYVAVGAGTDPELDIANVTSPPNGSSSPAINASTCGTVASGNASWKMVGSLDFNSASGTQESANSVFATPDGTRAYISSNGGDAKQLYVIDTSTKTAPKFLSGTPATGATSGYYLGTGANANLFPRRSLTVFGNSRALLAGVKGTGASDPEEYQVINTSTEASLSYCGGLDYAQGFNDLASVTEADNDKFVYMVSGSGGNQLKIIQGGPDGTYLDTGTYTSSPLDLGATVALNRMSTSTSLPANTTLTFQLAATSQVSGSCTNSTYTFVGPDGTSSTYFPATGGAVPLSGASGFENPARCIKYKAFLSTTDFNVTPSLLDVSVNYSP